MVVDHIFFLAILPLLAMGLPQNSPDLLTYSSSRSDSGYDFSYSTKDQSRDEHAIVLLQKDGEQSVEYLEVRGSYSFIGDDNRFYTVNYVAGINGYTAKMTISETPEETPKVPYIAPNVLKSLVG